MQAVRQLDHDHTDILCHGEEHLPQVLRLHLLLIRRSAFPVLLIAAEIDVLQFGHTVHQKRHIRSEFLRDFLHRHDGVFHHIVQKSGLNSLLIQFQIRKNDGHAQRVDDIGFAGFAHLSLVCLRGHLIRFFNHGDIIRWMVSAHPGNEILVQLFRAQVFLHGLNASVVNENPFTVLAGSGIQAAAALIYDFGLFFFLRGSLHDAFSLNAFCQLFFRHNRFIHNHTGISHIQPAAIENSGTHSSFPFIGQPAVTGLCIICEL